MMRSVVLTYAAALCMVASAQDVHVRVDPHGPGSIASTTDYTTIQQALDHAPEAPHGRIYIEIVPGVYHERINVTQNRPRVTLLGLGKSAADVVITAAQNAKSAGGTFFTETAEINGDNFEADNVTFENAVGNTGQAVAAAVRSDRAVFKHCRFLGHQDTLFADYGRQYYVDSYIEGGVDFIFGNAAAVFDHTEIHALSPGYLTAQSRTSPEQKTGYVIVDSRVTTSLGSAEDMANRPAADAAGARSTASAIRNGRLFTFLGRPWRMYSRVVFMHTELSAELAAAGWSKWKQSDAEVPKAFYAEYENSGPGWRPQERVGWSHQLTAAEAAEFMPREFLRGADGWNPVAEAARLP
jgi:pectinesterase